MDECIDGQMDGQLFGWVYVEFVGTDFSFLLGEEAQDRCDYQKFMAYCPFVNFFPFDIFNWTKDCARCQI